MKIEGKEVMYVDITHRPELWVGIELEFERMRGLLSQVSGLMESAYREGYQAARSLPGHQSDLWLESGSNRLAHTIEDTIDRKG